MARIDRPSFSICYPEANPVGVRAAETALFLRVPNLRTIREVILRPSIREVLKNSPNRIDYLERSHQGVQGFLMKSR